jgi:hypothetical protein
MMRDHTLIEELLSVRALDGLDGDDLALLDDRRREHGDCVECLRLEAGFNEVAGLLGLSLGPVPVDLGMADEIMSRAGSAPASVVGIAPAPPGDGLAPRRARRRRLVAVIAAAAAALVAITAVVVIRPERTTPSLRVSSDQRIVRFSGAAGASLAMAYTPGEPGVVMWGSGLPDPGPGKVYELWTIRGGTPTSAGCAEPADGQIGVGLPASPVAGDLMAVTVESTACPSAPTTTPILTAQLT